RPVGTVYPADTELLRQHGEAHEKFDGAAVEIGIAEPVDGEERHQHAHPVCGIEARETAQREIAPAVAMLQRQEDHEAGDDEEELDAIASERKPAHIGLKAVEIAMIGPERPPAVGTVV